MCSKETGEAFAVKIIRKTMREAAFQDVLFEAKICRKLQHPNIVRLLEIFDERKRLYLVFDLVVGGELFEDICNLEFYTEALASQCMQDILQAVTCFHQKGVVHRDLKAENILLTSKTKPTSIKVADFVSALEVKGDERVWAGTAGTTGYVAPEILRRQAYGKPIDVWSCGVILYLLLVGEEPFSDERGNLDEQTKAGVYSYPRSRKISAGAKDIVKRMLTLNPDKRITAEEALKHPWIRQPEKVAPRIHLAKTINHLKRFNTRRIFKAAGFVVLAAGKVFKRNSGRKPKFVKRLQLSHGIKAPKSKTDPSAEEMIKEEIVNLTEQLIDACEAGDSKTIQSLCETQETTFDSNQSGNILVGMDLENFFTENIPDEPYSEWNTEIVNPWVHVLSSKTAYIAYLRSTEYITDAGREHLLP